MLEITEESKLGMTLNFDYVFPVVIVTPTLFHFNFNGFVILHIQDNRRVETPKVFDH